MDYTGWLTLLAAFLVWELTGLKAARARVPWLAKGPLKHVSLSEVVWRLEGWGGKPVKLGIAAFLVDLIAHFLLHTPLL